jgi:hypothetical protein
MAIGCSHIHKIARKIIWHSWYTYLDNKRHFINCWDQTLNLDTQTMPLDSSQLCLQATQSQATPNNTITTWTASATSTFATSALYMLSTWISCIKTIGKGVPLNLCVEASSRHRPPPFRQLLDGHALVMQTSKKYWVKLSCFKTASCATLSWRDQWNLVFKMNTFSTYKSSTQLIN